MNFLLFTFCGKKIRAFARSSEPQLSTPSLAPSPTFTNLHLIICFIFRTRSLSAGITVCYCDTTMFRSSKTTSPPTIGQATRRLTDATFHLQRGIFFRTDSEHNLDSSKGFPREYEQRGQCQMPLVVKELTIQFPGRLNRVSLFSTPAETGSCPLLGIRSPVRWASHNRGDLGGVALAAMKTPPKEIRPPKLILGGPYTAWMAIRDD